MDILRLYQDYSVDSVSEGHKHTREGWINTECPYCEGNPGYHLGYHLEDDYYHCWRCGGHPVVKTLSLLLHIKYKEAETLVQQYGGTSHKPSSNKVITIQPFKFPSGTNVMIKNHRTYLKGRDFSPEELERVWGLLGTGPFSTLDGTDYKHRIIIPFTWEGKTVSFDSRSITKEASHESRYRACPKSREQIEHKHILYGKQVAWKDVGICVEGPTDVWRMGINSFATSGIQYTPQQIRVIAQHFRRVHILFDPESQAQVQAQKLKSELLFRGVDARVENILTSDPGSLPQEEANYLIKQFI